MIPMIHKEWKKWKNSREWRDHSPGPKFLLQLFLQSAASNGRTAEWFMCLAVNWKRKRIPGLYEVQTKPDTNQTRPNEADRKSKPNQNQTKPDQTRPNQAGSKPIVDPIIKLSIQTSSVTKNHSNHVYMQAKPFKLKQLLFVYIRQPKACSD
jgi:hypothetical protein